MQTEHEDNEAQMENRQRTEQNDEWMSGRRPSEEVVQDK